MSDSSIMSLIWASAFVIITIVIAVATIIYEKITRRKDK